MIVIDGLIFEGMSGSDLGIGGISAFNLGSNGTDPLLNLNPNDIESIEVLKDGAASAIYGSRGANGVILFITKRGKLNAKPRVKLGYFAGFAEPVAAYDVLNGREYAMLWNEAVRNIGAEDNPGWLLDEENQPSTDWFDLLTRRAFQQEATLSVSGGSNSTRYYISGSYRDEDGYYLDTNLKRYSFRANIDQIISSRVRAGLNLSAGLINMDRTFEGFTFEAPNNNVGVPPILEPFDSTGVLINPLIFPPLGNVIINPLVHLLENDLGLSVNQTLLLTYLEYQPWHFLKLRAELGAELTQSEDLARFSSLTVRGQGVEGRGIAGSTRLLNYNTTAFATYRTTFSSSHDLEITIGTHLTRRSIWRIEAGGTHFADERLFFLNGAAVTSGSSNRTDAAFTGFFGRANYAFSNKYLITLSARYDGSSRFGKNNRYGFFPALSAGWVLSEEAFFTSRFISILKLSGSIGRSGNGSIGDFANLGLVQGRSYAGDPAFVVSQLENRDLGWETTTQMNAGIDFSLWNNRMSGSVGYFLKNTRDLLLAVPIPGTAGLFSSFQNTGRVRNQGFEYDLSADLLTGEFRWNLSINGATLHNRVLELPDNNNDGVEDPIVNYFWIFRSGESMASWYLPRFAGVDPQNGDALFDDGEGGTVPVYPPSSANARALVGKTIPSFTGGISNTFEFKGFDLSAFLQFATGHSLYREEGGFLEINMSGPFNQLRSQLQAWTPEHTDTAVPQARQGKPNGSAPSTRYLDEAAYLRLKNLQIGYTFKGLGKQKGQLRVYASAMNLLTFTNYEGLDPEADHAYTSASISGSSFFPSPQNRTIVLGLNYEW